MSSFLKVKNLPSSSWMNGLQDMAAQCDETDGTLSQKDICDSPYIILRGDVV